MKIKYELYYSHIGSGFMNSLETVAEIKKIGLARMDKIYESEMELNETWSDRQIADAIFRLTNSSDSPLKTKKMQDFIHKTEACHTSMSIGDAVIITRQNTKPKIYVCSDFDWIEVAKET